MDFAFSSSVPTCLSPLYPLQPAHYLFTQAAATRTLVLSSLSTLRSRSIPVGTMVPTSGEDRPHALLLLSDPRTKELGACRLVGCLSRARPSLAQMLSKQECQPHRSCLSVSKALIGMCCPQATCHSSQWSTPASFPGHGVREGYQRSSPLFPPQDL